jgi:pyruvate ferredoxin oxidoreductase gamma subunit
VFKIVSFRYGGGYNPTLADTNGIFQVLNKEAESKEPLKRPYRYVNLYNEEPYELQIAEPELKEIKERTSNILILGRGGQGGVTTGTMMARIANGFGKNAGAISAFGSEKTGSPTFTRVTISEEMIQDNSDRGYTPEYLIILSPSVINELGKDVNESVTENGIVVVNTPKTPAEIREEFGIKGRKIVTIAASALSKETLGMDLPNVATLAALIFNTSAIIPEHEFMRAMDRELGQAFGAGSDKVALNRRMLRLVKEKMQVEKEEQK